MKSMHARRFIAILVSVAMVVSLTPLPAYAEAGSARQAP